MLLCVFLELSVQKCPNCGVDLQEGRPFCPACGKVRKIATRPSYAPTWIFLVVGLLVALFWAGFKNSPTTVVAVPLPTPTPDDAMALVQQCGNPDKDLTVPPKSETRTPERRWLLYSKARIRAGFEQESGAWKKIGYFDPVSRRRLELTQVMKRFPCAPSGPP
jgi:hypothetical protein